MPREFDLKALLEATSETLGERDVRVLRDDGMREVALGQTAADAELTRAMLDDAKSLDEMAFRLGRQRARAAFEQRLLRHVSAVNAEQSAWLCQVAADLFSAEQALLARVQEQVVSRDLDQAQAERVAAHIRQKTEHCVEQALRMTHETADFLRGHLTSILTTAA